MEEVKGQDRAAKKEEKLTFFEKWEALVPKIEPPKMTRQQKKTKDAPKDVIKEQKGTAAYDKKISDMASKMKEKLMSSVSPSSSPRSSHGGDSSPVSLDGENPLFNKNFNTESKDLKTNKIVGQKETNAGPGKGSVGKISNSGKVKKDGSPARSKAKPKPKQEVSVKNTANVETVDKSNTSKASKTAENQAEEKAPKSNKVDKTSKPGRESPNTLKSSLLDRAWRTPPRGRGKAKGKEGNLPSPKSPLITDTDYSLVQQFIKGSQDGDKVKPIKSKKPQSKERKQSPTKGKEVKKPTRKGVFSVWMDEFESGEDITKTEKVMKSKVKSTVNSDWMEEVDPSKVEIKVQKALKSKSKPSKLVAHGVQPDSDIQGKGSGEVDASDSCSTVSSTVSYVSSRRVSVASMDGLESLDGSISGMEGNPKVGHLKLKQPVLLITKMDSETIQKHLTPTSSPRDSPRASPRSGPNVKEKVGEHQLAPPKQPDGSSGRNSPNPPGDPKSGPSPRKPKLSAFEMANILEAVSRKHKSPKAKARKSVHKMLSPKGKPAKRRLSDGHKSGPESHGSAKPDRVLDEQVVPELLMPPSPAGSYKSDIVEIIPR